MSTEPPAFVVSLPGNWIAIDLQAAADRAALAAAVDTRLPDLPELEDFRDVFVEYTATVAQAAIERDVAFAAVLIDAADDETLPVLATMAVSYALLSEGHSDDGSRRSIEVENDGGETLVDEMTSIELPLGLALRRERVHDELGHNGEASITSFTVQYVLQPDAADYGVLVTFTSPMLPMREDLNAMFDRIVRGLRTPEASA